MTAVGPPRPRRRGIEPLQGDTKAPGYAGGLFTKSNSIFAVILGMVRQATPRAFGETSRRGVRPRHDGCRYLIVRQYALQPFKRSRSIERWMTAFCLRSKVCRFLSNARHNLYGQV